MIGTVIVAIISFINTQAQILLPVSLTQTAQSVQTPLMSSASIKFSNISETTEKASSAIFPINNCSGTAEVKQEIKQTYIHTINENGVEVPILQWKKIVAEIERHYGFSANQIETYSITFTAAAKQNIEFTIDVIQTWESGIASVVIDGVQITTPYRILTNESYEVKNTKQISCP